jgi:hypothetical protein
MLPLLKLFMDITIWFSFLLVVFALYFVSYIAKNIFFGALATILLILISLFALDLGLQNITGEVSVLDEYVETISYTYSEVEISGVELSQVVGVGGLLVGIYFLANLMMKIVGGG